MRLSKSIIIIIIIIIIILIIIIIIIAWVRTVKFISGAFFWPTGQLVIEYNGSSDDIFNDLIEPLDQPTFTGRTQDTVN